MKSMLEKIYLKGKKVTVMGLGLHGGGEAVTRWLAQQGAKVLVTDLRNKKTLQQSIYRLKPFNITYVLGQHRVKDFKNTDLIIKNPGVPRESKFLKIARQNNIPIETDISLFWRVCPAPIIGVTGTKGKSTTVSFIYEIFNSANKKPVLAGNIRISPLNLLDKINKNTPIILELSSWQLEDMAHLHRSPHLAVLTNILPDHLNRYKNMADYSTAKELIFRYQENNDISVVNADDRLSRKIGKNVSGKRFWFSTKYFAAQNGCFIKNNLIIWRDNGQETRICPVNNIKLPGLHNLEHILAGIAVAKIYRINTSIIIRAVKQFKGIPDRLELVRIWHNLKFINDTTATAPDAAIAALSCFNEKIILIAGGNDKNLSYIKLAKLIKQKAEFTVLLAGTATAKLVKELRNIKYNHWQIVNNMAGAVQLAVNAANVSKVIILSPGAASFGMFLNEFDRGDQFKKIVKQLS